MKLFISADMEGTGGVVSYDHIDNTTASYQDARLQMIKEVNAAIEGALAGGAEAVLVNDSHDTMTNLKSGMIDARAVLISGAGKPLSMMQGIKDAHGAIFLGYHAMAGTQTAILDHTYSGKIYRLKLNGTEVGETGLNAAIAGHYNIPVLTVTGDKAVCTEASQLIPRIETVMVKEAVCRTAAICLPLDICCNRIKEVVKKAIEKFKSGTMEVPPYKINYPVDLEIELITTGMTDLAELIPSVVRIGGRQIRARGKDMEETARTFFSILRLIGGYEGKLI